MRKIKFKAKRIDNGEWVEGFYIESSHEHHLGKRSLIACGDSSVRFVGRDFIEVDPSTVCQSTNLKDKNGKEIFEGDLIDSNTLCDENWEKGSNTDIYEVGFYSGSFCFMKNGRPVRQWKDGTQDWYSIENNDPFTLKVIGNIHDK